MKEFLYLFRGGENARSEQSPEEMQAHMQKWGMWMQQLAEAGQLVSGLPLKSEGKVVHKAGDVITDGPFAEGSEVVGGYLIVKAKDLNEATEISKGCPIYEHDGYTEVREMLPLDEY